MSNPDNSQTVVPYKDSELSKKKQVAKMFDNIAPRYDFLNHLLSLNVDHYWRWRMINRLKDIQPKAILDVATGTGDVAIAAMRLKPEKVMGVDISAEMLEYGKVKMTKKKLDNIVTMQLGDAENLDFADNSFDAITVAFGVRNFENLQKGIRELNRVLKPNGKLVVLEFSKPKAFPIKQFTIFTSSTFYLWWVVYFRVTTVPTPTYLHRYRHFPKAVNSSIFYHNQVLNQQNGYL